MRRFPIKFVIAFFVATGLLASAPGADAATLAELLPVLVKNQKQIKAKENAVEAARELLKAARGVWYPELNVVGNWGKEKQNNTTGTADTEEVPRELDIKVTQMIWDFGANNASIRIAELDLETAEIDLILTRQALILQGIEAYLNVIRAKKVLGFSRGSVANIKRQATLEDSRVQRGGGFTTDALQAKTQLAGAEARRNNFAGGLRNAINVFRRFFRVGPGDLNALQEPRVPYEMLPKSLDEVIRIMYESNPGLKNSKIASERARMEVKQTRANELFPKISATAEEKRKSDVGGTIGNKNEQLFKIEFNYSLNLGLTNYNTVAAKEADLRVAIEGEVDTRHAFEQQAQDNWSNLKRDKANIDFLKNQANIAAEFLELARRERQLGNRSLIDVLAGETALINANSDATAAETDLMINVFKILNIMGKLEAAVVK
ncbi:MAG: TolC family protein [Proteobacteria bacterium]|nr:TolC family protein [Pseudomonadota bacterium]